MPGIREGDELTALRNAVRSPSAHGVAWYELGVALLARFLSAREECFRAEAIPALRKAIALKPDMAEAHAALAGALGEQEESVGEALAEWRIAHRLAPENSVFEINLLALWSWSGPSPQLERRIAAAGRRHGVDLKAVRAELVAAGMPVDPRTLVANAFFSAANYFAAWVHDEVTRLAALRQPRRRQDRARRERERFARSRRALAQAFRRERVPAELAAFIPLVLRFGHGDDGCREHFASRMTSRERTRLRALIGRSGAAVGRWLDTFTPGRMPTEAAAFMYLLLAAEELGLMQESSAIPARSSPAKRLGARRSKPTAG